MKSKRSIESIKNEMKSHPANKVPFNLQRKLQKLEEEEERYLNVLYIREEILNNILDKCYEKYLEKQSVKFVVHCAHIALRRILNLNFFMHDPGSPCYLDHPDWLADKAADPSQVDNWAANNMAVLPKSPVEVDVCASPAVVEDLDVSVSTSQESKTLSEWTIESPVVSIISESSQDQTVKMTEESNSVSSAQSTISIFTKSKFISFHSLPQQLLPNNARMKEFFMQDVALSSLNLKASPRLGPIQLSLDKLPPIRALTKFKQNEKEEKKNK